MLEIPNLEKGVKFDEDGNGKINTGVVFGKVWPDGRPGLLGTGPLPRFLKETDQLLSVPYRKNTVSFFGVLDTPGIVVRFVHKFRTLGKEGENLIERESLAIVLPEIPTEVEWADQCLALVAGCNDPESPRLTKVSRQWLLQPDHKILEDPHEFLSEHEPHWKLWKMRVNITKISGCFPAWTTKWTKAHDKVRATRAHNLQKIQLPPPPDELPF